MIDLRYLHSSSGTVWESGNVAQNISNYPPHASNSIPIPPPREECSFARDPRIPPYNPINNNPPQPSGDQCLFDNSLMTEDAWKVLNMIEQANDACSRQFSGYDFGSAPEARIDYYNSIMKPNVNPGAPPDPAPAAAAIKPKIWSVEDIIGDSSSDGQSCGSGLDNNEPPKVTPGSSSSSSDDVINVYGRAKQSADGSGVVFSDYGYLDGNKFSGPDMPQLDTQFGATGGYHEPAKKSLDQQMQQEIVDGYCCKYITQIYYQKMYYKCIYCHRCYSNARQLCQHQIVEHRLIIS